MEERKFRRPLFLQTLLHSPSIVPIPDAGIHVDANVTQNLLLAHQSAWQRYLISHYGNEIMLLDATYKTMRYELPLFFLVKTNVNYVVVGSFVMQNETTASIKEALRIFRDWNPQWQPKLFISDLCFEEINARVYI